MRSHSPATAAGQVIAENQDPATRLRSPPSHERTTGNKVPTATIAVTVPSSATATRHHHTWSRLTRCVGRDRVAATIMTTAIPTSRMSRARPTALASAKACTDPVAPDRVSTAPMMASGKGTAAATTAPRPGRSPGLMWRATVTASHGTSAVFSTGSHAQ